MIVWLVVCKSRTSTISLHKNVPALMSEKKWLSVHLYYNQPWQELICDAVEPIVRTAVETGLAEQFFFIRFWSKGPHIRLRFFGQFDQLSQFLVPNLKEQYLNHIDFKPSYRNDPSYGPDFPESEKWYPNNSFQQIKYEPEYHRYGGPEGISLAEQQFFASSKVCLAILREKGNQWTYEDAMGKALLLHLCFVHAVRMDATEALKFFHMFSENWLQSAVARNPRINKPEEIEAEIQEQHMKYQRLFRSQKDQMLQMVSKVWTALEAGEEFESGYMNEWMLSQTEVAKSLIFLQADNNLRNRPDRFQYNIPNPEGFSQEKLERWMHYADFMHLTNNRLGINNQDEPYLAFLLSECLERVL